MKLRLFLGVVLVLAFASATFAQANEFRRFDIGWNVLSYSRQGSANLYGGDLSFAIHASDHVAIVADLAAHRRSELDFGTTTYRFGPRFSAHAGDRLTAFSEVLVGGTRLTDGSFNSTGINGFALAAGGGLDVGIKPWFALRVVQADYSLLRFSQFDTTSNGVRIGGGIVFRFGHRE